MFHLALFISLFYVGRGMDCGGNHVSNTIYVDQQGKGNFKTIQAAIDSIKNQNDKWIVINISFGTYKEKVHIPIEKPCIVLKGAGRGRKATTITYDDSAEHDGTSMSASFISSPPNVIVTGIQFENTFGTNSPAVAANFYGDKSAIFDSSFIGYQDTLLVSSGRSYFKNCYIQGEVDFICGSGQSYFENCVMNATQGQNKPPGFVTAQKRDTPNGKEGFVFKGCSVIGNGQVNLGRPWGSYSRVIFLDSYFASVVIPKGWDSWNQQSHVKDITFAEINCKGPGADTKNRVDWIKKPEDIKISEYTYSPFINSDGWLNNLPSV
ncbi:putative pectinesterase 10 [Vicia villosa]|uniref:putative pectinesterase 10 n=1 Tax=Vicia villosa TaxID=3911 RepID=UPI00273C64F6|nr:putative pectinesterase 10 [Vicia villosa]